MAFAVVTGVGDVFVGRVYFDFEGEEGVTGFVVGEFGGGGVYGFGAAAEGLLVFDFVDANDQVFYFLLVPKTHLLQLAAFLF